MVIDVLLVTKKDSWRINEKNMIVVSSIMKIQVNLIFYFPLPLYQFNTISMISSTQKKKTLLLLYYHDVSLSHAKSSCFWSPKDFISLYYQVKEYDVTKACHELFNKCLLILHLLILFISCLMSSLTQKGNVLTSILRHKKQFALL